MLNALCRILIRPFGRSRVTPSYRSLIRSPVRSPVRSLKLVFDVDNTLYSRKYKVMEYMGHRGIEYLENKFELYAEHNKQFFGKNETIANKMTRLNKEYDDFFHGLFIETGIDIDVPDYINFISERAASKCLKPTSTELHEVHSLFESLTKIPNLKIWTFSNGNKKHVSKVLDILKIKDYFDGHINLTSIFNKYKKPIRKPSQKAYQIAEHEMEFDKDFDKIYFIDDHDKNIKAAIERKNWIGILLDEKGTRSVDGALRIKSIQELKDIIPELFNNIKK